jgi:hypothetical protein
VARCQLTEQRLVEGDWGGPYVQAATFCEAVLEEKTSVISLFRLGERVVLSQTIVEGRIAESGVPVPVPVGGAEATIAILLRAGTARGVGRVTTDIVLPNGEFRLDATINDIAWPDPGADEIPDEKTIRLQLKVQIGPDLEGLLWVHLRYDGRLLTRIPLRLTVTPPTTERAAAQQMANGSVPRSEA